MPFLSENFFAGVKAGKGSILEGTMMLLLVFAPAALLPIKGLDVLVLLFVLALFPNKPPVEELEPVLAKRPPLETVCVLPNNVLVVGVTVFVLANKPPPVVVGLLPNKPPVALLLVLPNNDVPVFAVLVFAVLPNRPPVDAEFVLLLPNNPPEELGVATLVFPKSPLPMVGVLGLLVLLLLPNKPLDVAVLLLLLPKRPPLDALLLVLVLLVLLFPNKPVPVEEVLLVVLPKRPPLELLELLLLALLPNKPPPVVDGPALLLPPNRLLLVEEAVFEVFPNSPLAGLPKALPPDAPKEDCVVPNIYAIEKKKTK